MMNTWISRQFLAGFVVSVVLLVADTAYCQLHVQAEVVVQPNAQQVVTPSDSSPQASPATAPSTKPTTLPAPSADFTLHEWAIFVAEPLAPRANSVAAIKSTLPSFVVSRRPDAEGDDRAGFMPIGVIRILGGKTPSPKFDVLLNLKGGEFLGEWPKAESNRNNRLLWNNLVADEAKPTLSQLDEKHWLNRLRDGESRYLSVDRDTRGERFLLYDAEPAMVMPLRVEMSGDSAYRVANAGANPISDLEFYKSKDGAWRKGFVASLGASQSAAKAPTTKAADAPPKIKAGDLLRVTLEFTVNYVIDRQPTGKVSDGGDIALPNIGNVHIAGRTIDQAQQDITKRYSDSGMAPSKVTVEVQAKEEVVATTGPTGPAADVTLSTETFSDPKQMLAPWKERLAATGLSPVDDDLILDILAKYAIDPGRLTAVYMLDQSQMDDLLPEEVVPQPAKVSRVGLVIVRNIDPQINQEIAVLVKQLGDDEWSKREDAQKKLVEFGRAAKSAVEKAAKDKDMEVVWRAEAILRTIDPQKFTQMGQ